jgi:3-(3-hydroxy-phenyl)propionate hydroxylase
VIDGIAPEALLDSYSDERVVAADENIRNSTRSTDFITPKSRVSKTFRNAVLGLARQHPFARALVNSGRLSVPTLLTGSALNTPDAEPFDGWMVPGAPLADAPVVRNGQADWLLRQVGGNGFTLLVFGDATIELPATPVPLTVRRVKSPGSPVVAGDLIDGDGLASRRCDARPGTVYLIRPDQHVAARWRRYDADALQAALARALCLN